MQVFQGFLVFLKHILLLQYKGFQFLSFGYFNYDNNSSLIILNQLFDNLTNPYIIAIISIFISILFLSTGYTSFIASFKPQREYIKWQRYLLYQYTQTGTHYNNKGQLHIILLKVYQLQRLNSSLCQVGFAQLLLVYTYIFDAITLLLPFTSINYYTIPTMLYNIYPILYILSYLIVLKSLSYLIHLENLKIISYKTAINILQHTLYNMLLYNKDNIHTSEYCYNIDLYDALLTLLTSSSSTSTSAVEGGTGDEGVEPAGEEETGAGFSAGNRFQLMVTGGAEEEGEPVKLFTPEVSILYIIFL